MKLQQKNVKLKEFIKTKNKFYILKKVPTSTNWEEMLKFHDI